MPVCPICTFLKFSDWFVSPGRSNPWKRHCTLRAGSGTSTFNATVSPSNIDRVAAKLANFSPPVLDDKTGNVVVMPSAVRQ